VNAVFTYTKKMVKNYLHVSSPKQTARVWYQKCCITVEILSHYFRSFFQSVCVLGYCLLPTTIALIVCRIILLMNPSTLLFVIRFIVTMVGFGWATFGKCMQSTKEIPNKYKMTVMGSKLFSMETADIVAQ